MARSYLYVLPSPNVVRGMASKKVTVRALWEVDLKQPTTKSNPDLKIETAQNNQKKGLPDAGKENVRDIISRSFKSNINRPLGGGHKLF